MHVFQLTRNPGQGMPGRDASIFYHANASILLDFCSYNLLDVGLTQWLSFHIFRPNVLVHDGIFIVLAQNSEPCCFIT